MEFQTRSESTGLAVHPTLEAALDAAIADESIWKVSFSIAETGERIRLVWDDVVAAWKLESLGLGLKAETALRASAV